MDKKRKGSRKGRERESGKKIVGGDDVRSLQKEGN